MFDLHSHFDSPLILNAPELLKAPEGYAVKVSCSEGEGVALLVQNALGVLPLLLDRVFPFFKGKDARDLETLMDELERHRSNYKFGLAFWMAAAGVELAIWDMLGKLKGVPVHKLLGPTQRDSVEVYMSSMRRDTTPEQEVAWVGERLSATNSKAVKLKIGGRMSHNADASPGRTEALVTKAREAWGPDMTIYVDANGSYDADGAIAIAPCLEEKGVAWLEEPCPFLHYEDTLRANRETSIPVVGGEQDTCLYRFEWMAREKAVDILQPDVHYCGGLVRLMRVAEIAQRYGLSLAPHSPKNDARCAHVLHALAVMSDINQYQEFHANPFTPPSWQSEAFVPENGRLTIPMGPGIGVELDGLVAC